MDDTRIVPAGEFKANCLQLIDQAAESRTEYIITKDGKPLAKLVPLDAGAHLMGSVTLINGANDLLRTDVSWHARATTPQPAAPA